MQPEPIPLDLFIQNCLQDRVVREITEGWRLEVDKLQLILAKHFREMGIFFVAPHHAQMLRDALQHHLKYSSEIRKTLKKLEVEEQARRKVRMTDP